ncbi:MAG: peroxiredoxin family protein [Marinifilaceae bacterium]
MTRIKLVFIAFCLTIFLPYSNKVKAQNILPKTELKTLVGKNIQSTDILADSVPVIITFWSTTCKPCITELDAFASKYKEMQEQMNFKIVAIATDDQRTSSKVMPMVKGRRWPFEVYRDQNQDLKRLMNVNVQPQLFILDKTGKIIYSHSGYVPMGEDIVFKKMLELLRK